MSALLAVYVTFWFWMPAAGPAAEPASAAGLAGHWEGSIQLPTVPLETRVDLEQIAGGAWSGTIDIPVQGLRSFKLGGVSVRGSEVAFVMPGVPGEPKFAGAFDSAAQRIRGRFTQGGSWYPFEFERKTTVRPGETPARGVPGKGLAGFWQGSLNPTPVIELRLLLEITNAPPSGLGAVVTSLDQGGAKIPVSSLSQEVDAVRFETKSVGGSFEGKLNPEGSELAGTWRQGGSTMPLAFKRLEKPPVTARPQDPKGPRPYREEEVAIATDSAGVTLAGTLTLPRAPGPHPAVVLITGSGPQDRDEAIMGHRPFLVLADHLTRQGIAVLRCDDRGFGRSSGRFDLATHLDFVEDTLAQMAFLRSRKEIDPRRIGLIGHSEGGIVAPLAAVRMPETAFIVLLAGVGVPTEDLLVRQGADLSRALGAGEDAIARNAELQRVMFRMVREEKDPAVLKRRLREAAREHMASLTPAEKAALQLSDDMLEAQLSMVISPWFRGLLGYDPRPTLKAVKCPVLALNGEKDLQVSAKENLGAIRESLSAGGNSAFKALELPGLNHLFQTCQTGTIAEYSRIDETFNPRALTEISNWILTTAKRGGQAERGP